VQYGHVLVHMKVILPLICQLCCCVRKQRFNILSDVFLILKFQSYSYMQVALHILLITEESFYTFRYSNL